jgi:uncharacterized protein with von Willebrand factor type A (vWA) domain
MSEPDSDMSWLDVDTDGDPSEDRWLRTDGQDQEVPTKFGLKLDKWGQRQGEELEKLKEFQSLSAKAEDISDMHGMAFGYDPVLNKTCADPHKLDYLKSMLENDEYQSLRNSTRLDKMASELAALHFTGQWTTYKLSREKQDKKDQKDGKGEPSAKDQLRQEMKTSAAVNKAIEAAQQEVSELNDAREAMGIGSESGTLQGMSVQQVKKMFQRVKHNASLKDILRRAGRYRLAARAAQHRKTKHGYDDMIGVTLGAEISKLMSSELAALAHEDLGIDAIRRFAERQMACREYQGVQNMAKGPIIIIIDESGSMGEGAGTPRGSRIENAKGLAMAMAWVAKTQNRWCGFIGFSGPGQTRAIALPPNKWPAEQVMTWLEGFLGGGTSIPVKEVPKLYEEMGAPKGKTDLICITDGDVPAVPPAAMAEFKAWRTKAECKFIGITIASEAAPLLAISDEFYRIPALSPENDAVERVLGI